MVAVYSMFLVVFIFTLYMQAYGEYLGFVLALNEAVHGKTLKCDYEVSEVAVWLCLFMFFLLLSLLDVIPDLFFFWFVLLQYIPPFFCYFIQHYKTVIDFVHL